MCVHKTIQKSKGIINIEVMVVVTSQGQIRKYYQQRAHKLVQVSRTILFLKLSSKEEYWVNEHWFFFYVFHILKSMNIYAWECIETF